MRHSRHASSLSIATPGSSPGPLGNASHDSRVDYDTRRATLGHNILPSVTGSSSKRPLQRAMFESSAF
jgi:hypothetical protein